MEFSSYINGWRQRAQKERQHTEARRQKAIEEAQRIARFLGENVGAAKVIGIGSMFDPDRFKPRSDIDLVVLGLPNEGYFSILGQIMALTEFSVDLVPYESATELLKQQVAETGVQLWPQKPETNSNESPQKFVTN